MKFIRIDQPECSTRGARRRAWLRAVASLAVLAAVLAGFAPSTRAQILPGSSTTNWVGVGYLSSTPDPANDTGTGIREADIVGNTNHFSFYTDFYNGGTPSTTDGSIGFRVRLAVDSGAAGFGHIAFVGIDGNSDGRLDVFVGVDNTGQNRIKVWKATAGTNFNTTPANLSVNTSELFSYTETGANYDWALVTSANDPLTTNFNLDGASGGGQGDMFLSFVLPLADLVSAMTNVGILGFNENTAVRYVVGTSTSANNINQDINGVSGGLSSTQTWSALGVLSQDYSISGVLVPEPSTLALWCGAAGLAAARWRRRRR